MQQSKLPDETYLEAGYVSGDEDTSAMLIIPRFMAGGGSGSIWAIAGRQCWILVRGPARFFAKIIGFDANRLWVWVKPSEVSSRRLEFLPVREINTRGTIAIHVEDIHRIDYRYVYNYK